VDESVDWVSERREGERREEGGDEEIRERR